MKFRLILFLIFYTLVSTNLDADEIEIISDHIKILENRNIIKSINTTAEIKKKKLSLRGNNSIYNKKKGEIFLDGDVNFIDAVENIKIITESATYNNNTNILSTIGDTKIEYENKYEVLSKNMIYDKNSQKIFSKNETKIKDTEGNVYTINYKFDLDLVKEEVTTSEVSILDKNNNIYFFKNAKIDLANKEVVGRELKIDFIDNYFGNSKNDPILKGRAATSNDKETKIFKTVFSTCNTENKSCPGWEIETEEFTHDKLNKTFNYKNSWLKLFNQEIFYLPFFSHPDPSVKRKTGFLPPTYGSSNNYGSWINLPYFKALDYDKDLTFKPRIYLDDKLILQSEYRQAFENSNLLSDFSYNNDGKNTNSHFFIKTSGYTHNGYDYDFQYQSVSNDEYLKLHNLSKSSTIITDESLLTSNFNIKNQIDKDTKFTSEFFAYEDLSKKDSDRFQYILPSFNFNKKINIDKRYNGNFYFNSAGYQKQYDTNKYQAVITNDFLFNSTSFVSNRGFKSNYQFLLKHDSSYNSNPNADGSSSDLYQSILFKSELPLIKSTESSENYLKPIFAAKLSPNNSKDISNNDLRLSYDNIFSFNRIGSSRNIEEGRSLSVGVEYTKSYNENSNFLKFGIANSLSDKKNNNLPSKSKLDQTRSDIVGKLSFNLAKVLNVNYNFSYDRDFKNSNYQSISTDLKFDKLYTSFNYLSQDNEIGNDETISNTTGFNINSENILKFNSTKNLKTDFTEYYNLIYQYETDCLTTSIEFQKKFYKDGSIQPDKSLLFYVRFIPFAELRPEATNLN